MFSSLARFMEWTFPSHLVARSLDNHESEQVQNLRHGYISSEFPEIDPCHGKLKFNKNREEELVISYRPRGGCWAVAGVR